MSPGHWARIKMLLVSAFSLLLTFSCRRDNDETNTIATSTVSLEELTGGSTTVFDASPGAYRNPLANLNSDQLSQFQRGEAIFHSAFNNLEGNEFYGLGPLFIESSCGGCHINNGRGALSTISQQGLLLRLSLQGTDEYGGPLSISGFGTQLQTQTISPNSPEGTLEVTWEYHDVVFPDGHTVVLKQPYFSIANPYTPLPDFYLRGARHAGPIFGLGLLEAVPIETWQALADESDIDGDGISGKLNWVRDVYSQQMDFGLFGWKSSAPHLFQQTADAFHQDMGITSPQFSLENCYEQLNCQGVQEGIDAENSILSDVVFYLRTLAPPAARNTSDPKFLQGKALFTSLECARCHVPEVQTGPHPIAELSFQVIRPYSDMLLHELGAGLGDGRPDYLAGANEWRTPPLWGIGLSKTVYSQAGYLHDGRAETLEEAILWHEGEAFQSRQAYIQLNAEERAALIYFLESL